MVTKGRCTSPTQHFTAIPFRRRHLFLFLVCGSIAFLCRVCAYFELSPIHHFHNAIFNEQFHSMTNDVLYSDDFIDAVNVIPRYTVPPTTPFTDARRCVFEIENETDSYNVCDKIKIKIQARDQFNDCKRNGGDYFRAKIFSINLRASSSTDGEIVDHNDGSYSAFFTLRWSGIVLIEVVLVHSSEATAAMERVRTVHPIRMVYEGKFEIGKTIHTMRCHIIVPFTKRFCNFTDPATGEPWFCEKPVDLPCSAYAYHQGNVKVGERDTTAMFTQEEKRIFRPKMRLEMKQLVVNAADKLTLCDKNIGQCNTTNTSSKPNKMMASGFYYNDIWFSNHCLLTNIQIKSQFALSCLKNKQFYFYGDSTIRQWFEYFVENVPGTTEMHTSRVNVKAGPLYASQANNLLQLFYRHHAFPIRNSWMSVDDIKWIANEIDHITGDENTVIFLTLFAHFVPTGIEVYRSRLLTIKRALHRLYVRSPKSLVFFKSANTRMYRYNAADSVNYGDWGTLKLDQEMHRIMNDVPNLTIIDVWGMTSCHWSGDSIHPHPIVINEEIKIMLSYLCH